jgi:hypothetical protein
VGSLFVLASSAVPDLEPLGVVRQVSAIEPVRYESSCAAVQRQVDEIGRSATACEADPGCLLSPILCPVVLDENRAREYDRLRDWLDRECGITRSASYRPHRRSSYEAEVCGVSEEVPKTPSTPHSSQTYVF